MNNNTLSINQSINLSEPAFDAKMLPGLMRSNNMTSEDIRRILEMYERDEILSKYTFPSKPNSAGLYRMWVDDMTAKEGRRQISAKNLDNLKEKVYRHAIGEIEDAKITFEKAFHMAQQFEINNCSRERQYSKINTINRNESEYNRFFAGTDFANKDITEITMLDLDTVIRQVVREKDLTKKGLDSIRSIINMTYKRAFFTGIINVNTAARIIWKDYKRLLREPKSIISRAYSDAEIDMFYKFISDQHIKKPYYIPAYALEFQIITGTRRGEIPPLTWDDVDFEKGTIYIHREQVSCQSTKGVDDHIVEYTKNGKARFYPIADLEMEFLKRLYEIDKKYYPDSPYLFPAESANGCITNNMVYQFFRRMCSHLDIPVSRECIRGTHAFRRNAITEVVNSSNGNVILAAQMFGNSPETIRNYYYTTEYLEKKRQILNKRKRKPSIVSV